MQPYEENQEGAPTKQNSSMEETREKKCKTTERGENNLS